MMTPTIAIATQTRNKFESFEEFKSFVSQSFIEGSEIDPEQFDACIKFHQDLEFNDGHDVSTPIHDALGWEFKRFGHSANEPLYAAFLMNEDGSIWQAVLSLWDEERQRPYRYLAPKDNGDRAFLPPIPLGVRKRIGNKYGIEVPIEGSFWEWVKDIDIPRIPTEGGKKGLCGLSHGYLTIGLYGCMCGAKNKDELGSDVQPYLISDLQQFAGEGSKWLFAFDRDEAQKAKISVASGKKKLRLALEANLCASEDIVWKPEDGKGLDDLMLNKGSGEFDAAYQRTIARLEKLFKSENKTQKIPPADVVALQIAEEYGKVLIYNNEIGQWMRYEADLPGMWSVETNEFFESIVYSLVTAKGIVGYNSQSYITNICKILRCKLICRKWNERSPKDLLPFTNGVHEIKTGKLLPHSPEYHLTWQLPREYNPIAGDWSKIDSFLDHLTNGNESLKELLICYCNAVIKGRYDLQKFVHLIGLGGTGKGTFARLVTSLIGVDNVLTTSLDDWCTNRFEGANAYRKRLVLFPDEDKQTGKLGKFLSLTGEDLIRAEEKGKKAFQFRYDGMVLVLSNLPIFTGESASRVKRRVVPIPCNNPVATKARRNLEAEFEPQLAAFTNYVLSISDERVKNVLLGLEEIPECTLEFWENRLRVDSIAAWINNHVIYDPMAETAVGCDRSEGEAGAAITTLFGSYNRYCRQVGDLPKSHKNFSPDLLELCRSVLGWDVERRVTKTGKFIRGLRLRVDGPDDQIPTYDYTLLQLVTAAVTVHNRGGDGSGDGSQSLPDKDSNSGDSSSSIAEKKETQVDLKTNDLPTDKRSIDNQPLPTPKPIQSKPEEPSPTPTKATVTPTVTSESPEPTDNFIVGDQVQVTPTADYPRQRKIKGRTVVISTIDSNGIWVKVSKTGCPEGPFHPHQLKKC